MRFYKTPLNYGQPRARSGMAFAPEVQDNDYNTVFTGTNLTVNIDAEGDGTGTARRWTEVFVKGRFPTSKEYTVAGMPKTIPETITTFGVERSLKDVDGFYNHLAFHNLDIDADRTTRTAQSIDFTFPADAEIAQVLILDEAENIKLSSDGRFAEIGFTYEARGAIIQQSATGVLSSAPPLNNTRPKWSVEYAANYRPRHSTYEYLLQFMRQNYNFTVAVDYPRYPHMVFPAVFPQLSKQLRYITTWKEAGKLLTLSISER